MTEMNRKGDGIKASREVYVTDTSVPIEEPNIFHKIGGSDKEEV